jgi:hypothetical protein
MPTPTESYLNNPYFFPIAPESTRWQYISAITAFLVLYAFSIFIIKTNTDLMIVESANQTPGFFFVILTGMYINTQRIVPEIIAGILIYIAIIILLYSNKKYKALKNCFNAGLCFGFSILLVNEFIIFLLIIFITLLLIRSFNWREFVSLISGILCILTIVCSLIYLYGDFNAFVGTLKYPFDIKTSVGISNNTHSLYIFLPIIILSIIAIFSKFTLKTSQNTFTRNSQNIIITFLVFSIIYFISPYANKEAIVILYAPLSLLLANLFIKTRKLASYILLCSLIGCVIFLQIIQYKIFY